MDLIGEIQGGTVFIQMGIFISLMIILHFVLFKPYLRLYEERGRRLNPQDSRLKEMAMKADSLEASYRSEIRAIRERLIAETQKLREEAKTQEREMLLSAKNEAAQKLSEAIQRMRAEVGETEKGIARESEAIAKELASKVLGREV
ncbi:MAG: hypothetical protein Kow0090_04080 [Myxococcota bacterium]